jgi:UDP-3-O-[3-hydroxymyristoyl] glucosamine N-acyltransferase
MKDSHPASTRSPLSLADIAETVGGRLRGDPGLGVRGVAPVDEAGPDELALLTTKRYAKYVGDSRAGAFLVTEEMEAYVGDDRPCVVVTEPQRALIALLTALHPPAPRPAGVHPTAVLGEGVRLGADVAIDPYAVLGDGVEVGDGSRIGAHVVVGDHARIGAGCTLHPQVVLYPYSILGDRVILHSGVRIGADGFGYAFLDGAHRRIPHTGRAVVASEVEIGANTTVDRGSIGDTVVGEGVKIDNLVMVGHNVHIGEGSMIAGMAGISGSTRIGRGVWMGGQAGLIGHLEIGDGARLLVASKTMRDVPPGETMSGHPARPHREDTKRLAHLGRIEKLIERVKALEAEVRALKGPGDRLDT